MRRAVSMMLGLAALAAGPAVLAHPVLPPDPFEFSYPDSGLSAYDKVILACGGLEHRYGRNAAWGYWKLPLAAIRLEPPRIQQGKAVVAAVCQDGSACIAAGKLEDTSDRIDRHDVEFESQPQAQAFIDRVTLYQGLCRETGA